MTLASKLNRLSPEERTQLALRLSSAKRQAASKKTTGLAEVHPDLENRFEPFPLTDLQQAYLIGRSEGIELGNISCHCYFRSRYRTLGPGTFPGSLAKSNRSA